jgi:hypothetical protein
LTRVNPDGSFGVEGRPHELQHLVECMRTQGRSFQGFQTPEEERQVRLARMHRVFNETCWNAGGTPRPNFYIGDDFRFFIREENGKLYATTGGSAQLEAVVACIRKNGVSVE